jgi:hypothetical protein
MWIKGIGTAGGLQRQHALKRGANLIPFVIRHFVALPSPDGLGYYLAALRASGRETPLDTAAVATGGAGPYWRISCVYASQNTGTQSWHDANQRRSVSFWHPCGVLCAIAICNRGYRRRPRLRRGARPQPPANGFYPFGI